MTIVQLWTHTTTFIYMYKSVINKIMKRYLMRSSRREEKLKNPLFIFLVGAKITLKLMSVIGARNTRKKNKTRKKN
jgi:hypothetical protein